jgi:hypothetical protein
MGEEATRDLVPTLERWVTFGGVWRVVALGEDAATISLCRCDGGEEVERLTTTHPGTLSYLRESGTA